MKKVRNILILLLIIVGLLACHEESPRTRLKFNADWKFVLQDSLVPGMPELEDPRWRTINLPHDWSIEGEFSIDHPTQPEGGALPAGIGWYRKDFIVDHADKGKCFYIEFDGIYRNSEVWINGNFLGKRANGYISFRYELTPFLKFNGEKNIIVVKVDNSLQPNSRWYTGSGIYRNVWLVKTSLLHIGHWKTFVSTPMVSADHALIQINTSLSGRTDGIKNLRFRSILQDQKGEKINSAETFMTSWDSVPSFSQGLHLNNPVLWTPEVPRLYQLSMEVYANNKKVDEQIINFGIRNFYFDTDSGFYLNGKRYEIRGVNLHHDLGALGAAVNIRAIERQLEIMKGMGVNAIRTAHNPPAPEILELCDKMGFLVIDEAFDVWQKKKIKYDYSIDWEENYSRDLRDMVLRDRNHPSVFMWSIGNEIREQFDSSGTTLTRELVNIVKSTDTTRPVTCALTETDPERNFIYQSGALDVLGFNYKHENWADFKKNFPGQKMIATENASAFATRGHYYMPSDVVLRWPENMDDPIGKTNDDFAISAYGMICAYWGATHEETLKDFNQTDFLNGIFIWSGFDFIGEPVPYGWPAKNSYYGIVDLAGFPKDVYYLYQSIWTRKPMLHIFPHWNWQEGQLIDVWAYYNQADEVELFLNDRSLGTRKKEKDDYHVMWRINYQPGVLKVISRIDGNKVLEKEIRTAEKPARISLEADRDRIKADGCDLSFVTVKILDEHGTLVPQANNMINFKIMGNGFIAGVDNGYQASHESFKTHQRKTFNGMCLAIVQSDGLAGEIILQANSENLENQTITIIAE